MPKYSRYLLVGSLEANTGKSATVLGLASQLREKGLPIVYGKPLGNSIGEDYAKNAQVGDADVEFIASTLELPPDLLLPTILCVDEQSIETGLSVGKDSSAKTLRDRTVTGRSGLLEIYSQVPSDSLVLLEGPGTLAEGSLFNLSLLQIATVVEAAVLLVARFNSEGMVDGLLSAKQRLGDRLVGVLINDITNEKRGNVQQTIVPFLEAQGIPVLGRLPRSNLLQSVSVFELVQQLDAEVLCCPDRLDLMVESLRIGAMNVNSALKYFAKGENMAVVTGGDRTDMQLAALETSTQCLVLTGLIPPSEMILNRAEELEVPILSVDKDTLSTVEIIDSTFGRVRLREPVKVECIQKLMASHFDIDRLLELLGRIPECGEERTVGWEGLKVNREQRRKAAKKKGKGDRGIGGNN
ncbi:MAG: phosphotransacetylase family protein [Hormoscilla sp. SP12CHS1]|nr:phosphotransacetylase family protein [Hormoscilla sp. SP12CHS1]